MYNRYQNIKYIKKDSYYNQYFVNNIYPDIPVTDTDQYVITVLGDRLDILAQNIYGDSNLWWIISSANSLPGDSLVPPIGRQLRIPTDIQAIVNAYDAINKVR